MDDHLQTEKNVFVVFYAGEKVKAKILKICDAFGANRYPFAEELGKQTEMIAEVCILVLISLKEKLLYLPHATPIFFSSLWTSLSLHFNCGSGGIWCSIIDLDIRVRWSSLAQIRSK